MIHFKVWIVLPQRKETPTRIRNLVSSKKKLKDHNLNQVAHLKFTFIEVF